MSKITRPDADVVAFASQAQSGERTVFGDDTTVSDDLTDNLNTDFIRGWAAGLDPVNGFPPMEYFSGQMFTTSQLVSYLFQMGISEWNTNQYYPENAIAMDANGVIWKSLQDHTGQAQAEGAYWTNTEAEALTPNSISGLILSNAADSDHDIAISPGKAIDSGNDAYMELASSITKKIDAAWAEGTNAGGLFSGTVAADTTYHMFIIEKDSDGSIDAGFDTSITAANIPTGYTAYRRIGSVITNSSANIYGFESHEIAGGSVGYIWDVEKLDFSAATIGNTTRNLLTLSVPIDIEPIAILDINAGYSGISYTWVRTTSYTDAAASANNCSFYTQAGAIRATTMPNMQTDGNAQISYRTQQANVQLTVLTIGFTDRRID